MSTLNQIKKKQQRIARLEKSKAMDQVRERRAATRRKIEFGGLVVKSGMDAFSKSEILGALTYTNNLINGDANYLDHFRAIGDNLFLGIEDNERNDS